MVFRICQGILARSSRRGGCRTGRVPGAWSDRRARSGAPTRSRPGFMGSPRGLHREPASTRPGSAPANGRSPSGQGARSRSDPGDPDGGEAWRELYQELGRLPDRFRRPILLCHLEGLSYHAGRRTARLPGPDGPVATCSWPKAASGKTDPPRRGAGDSDTRSRPGARRGQGGRLTDLEACDDHGRGPLCGRERAFSSWSPRRFPHWQKELRDR